nr:suppressor of fused domain protein [Paenibacillus alvei]
MVRPYDGLTSYSTIGLSDYTIGYSVNEKPLRTEIVRACATEYEFFPNILTTCAFFIINSKFSVSPGKIFQDIIQMYYLDYEMKHVLFTSPFLWEDPLITIPVCLW